MGLFQCGLRSGWTTSPQVLSRQRFLLTLWFEQLRMPGSDQCEYFSERSRTGREKQRRWTWLINWPWSFAIKNKNQWRPQKNEVAIQTCSRCFEPSVTRIPRARYVSSGCYGLHKKSLTIAQELTEEESRLFRLLVCLAIHQYVISRFQIYRKQSRHLRRRIG